MPPLVFAGEARRLKSLPGRCRRWPGLFCSRAATAPKVSRNSRPTMIRDTFRLILQMAVVLTFAGRQAGGESRANGRSVRQAKDRDDRDHWGCDFAVLSRRHDDRYISIRRNGRLTLSGCSRPMAGSAATLNLLRALAGQSDLHNIHRVDLLFVEGSPQGARYRELTDDQRGPDVHGGDRGHAAKPPGPASGGILHLSRSPAARVRGSVDAGRLHLRRLYDVSAHLLWIGERTRQRDGAHVEFLRGIRNPIGLKVGPTLEADELMALIEAVPIPDGEPARPRSTAGSAPTRSPRDCPA